jgi:hypothetical protein
MNEWMNTYIHRYLFPWFSEIMAISVVFLSFGALQFGKGNKDSIIGHHLFPHDIKG